MQGFWAQNVFKTSARLIPCRELISMHNLVDVSDIFYFFCSGEGKRGVRSDREGGGVGFY